LILSAKKQRELDERASVAGDRPLAIGESSRAPHDLDEKILADNIRYFGEPVYEYDLSQGIEDGYLAPPEIFTFDLFHDQKTTPERTTPVLRADLVGKKLTEVTTHRPVSPEALGMASARPDCEQLFPVERTEALPGTSSGSSSSTATRAEDDCVLRQRPTPTGWPTS
jgi:superfamily II DNA or RNA helicase